jgi:hypothetical protein
MIPIVADRMQGHAAILLEEPPTPGFDRMLAGSLSIDTYLMSVDFEYLEFSRGIYRRLREIKRSGTSIYQVEPYLESLVAIHEFFADGHSPGELDRASASFRVYASERKATGALLAYYQAAMNAAFDQIIEAVKRFARLDAARFRLRDNMRAQALAVLLEKYESSYVEAGPMHYPLGRLLRQYLPRARSVDTVFHSDTALKMLHRNGHLYGPGDQLTLLYIIHPDFEDRRRENLLAARSLIYNKILLKEELIPGRHPFPHTRDEWRCMEAVKKLGLEDCRNLFAYVRRADTSKSRRIIAKYLGCENGDARRTT